MNDVTQPGERRWRFSAQEMKKRLSDSRLLLAADGGRDALVALSAFLFLRWADYYENEQQAIAAFEDREHDPCLPQGLRWETWRSFSAEELLILYGLHDLPSVKHPGLPKLAHTVARLAVALRRVNQLPGDILKELRQWVDDLPFDTPAAHRQVGEVLAQVVQRVRRQSGKLSGEFATPPGVVELMVRLIDPQPGERILDPCFGEGGLLTSCAVHIQSTAGRMSPRVWSELCGNSIYGYERNPAAYVLTLTRLVLAGITNPGLELGDALERPLPLGRSAESFDCIVANPPFGGRAADAVQSHFPIKTRDTVALFVQLAMSSLRPNGRAVVVVPSGFLFRTGPERRVRERLLTEFHVDGVVSLPPGTLQPYTSIPVNLLVFRRAEPNPSVKFLQVPHFPVTKPSGARDWSKHAAECVAQAAAAAEKFREGIPNSLLWEISIDDLRLRDWDLQARRSGDERIATFLESLEDVEAEVSRKQLKDIAELRAGLSYDRKTTTDVATEAQYPLLRVGDIADGALKKPTLFIAQDGATSIDDRRLTNVGDVLVTASGTIGKVGLVGDAAVGQVPAKSIVTIRTKAGILPEFLHALLQSECYQRWLTGHARGATVQHLSLTPLRNLAIPVPSVQVQEKLVRLWRKQGGDASALLLRVLTAADADPLILWLESAPEVIALIRGDPRALKEGRSRFLEKFLTSLHAQRNFAVHAADRAVPKELLKWAMLLESATENLQGIASVPAGAARFSMVESARVGVQRAADSLDESSPPIASIAREVTERLKALIKSEAEAMLAFGELAASLSPSVVPAGEPSEVILRLHNPSSLPLRALSVETTPDLGNISNAYLTENGEVSVPLRLQPTQTDESLTFLATWNCRRLDGARIQGKIPLTVEVTTFGETQSPVEMGTSPYNGQDAVERGEMFFGRRPILDRIVAQLSKQHPASVILLEGNRRMGKTSILKRLVGDKLLPEWEIVQCNFQKGTGFRQGKTDAERRALPTSEVFRVMTRMIGEQIYSSGIETWLPGIPARPRREPFKIEFKRAYDAAFAAENPNETFEMYIEAALAAMHPRKLLLALDEFDKIHEGIKAGVTSPIVPENLRYLVNSHPGFSIMMMGSRRLKRLREDYWSALFGLGEQIYVGPLSVAEARELVTEPVAGKLTYVPEAQDRLITLCACRPNLIQKFCDRLFHRAKEKGSRVISLGEVETVAREEMADDEHFAVLWAYAHTDRRKFVLSLCVRLSDQDEAVSFARIQEAMDQYGIYIPREESLEGDIETLRELELLEIDTSSPGSAVYAVAVPLLAEYIRKNTDFDVQCGLAVKEGEEKQI